MRSGACLMPLRAEAPEDKYLVYLDSRSFTLDQPTDLHIRRADHRVRFIHLEGSDFFNTLRDKLAWGLDVRSGPPVLKANG